MSAPTWLRIDLNADLGEGMGNDGHLLAIVTSANVACGGHAGDVASMREVVDMAQAQGVALGAHPSYPDREGFGRRAMQLAKPAIVQLMQRQIGTLAEVAASRHAQVRYVKPHGALGNQAAVDARVADALVEAMALHFPHMSLLAMAGSVLQRRGEAAGLIVYQEVYADRGYSMAGTLVPRGQPGALILDDAAAVQRLHQYIRTGVMPTVDETGIETAGAGRGVQLAADSICVHGDNAHAVECARQVRAMLHRHVGAVTAFSHP